MTVPSRSGKRISPLSLTSEPNRACDRCGSGRTKRVHETEDDDRFPLAGPVPPVPPLPAGFPPAGFPSAGGGPVGCVSIVVGSLVFGVVGWAGWGVSLVRGA